MRKKEHRRSVLRSARFERFEERLALSAQPISSLAPIDDSPAMEHFGEVTPAPVQQFGDAPSLEHLLSEAPPLSQMGAPDFRLSSSVETISQAGDVSSLLNGAHNLTGVNYVYENFGLTGRSQTVAVIDSGVDYLHGSLGGGLGANHRVVGGYDFAENDADPYDDGPSGFHGTHVAGIVGSDHASYRGVAPEADIVALRVFDDQGAGYFHWVEQALQWVHDHRDDYDNPITAVNLSLGAEWNSDSVPNWANLEDEFAQLEADGIFIAVAAGNSFSNYNAAGLSYPAVSPYVVPVASVNDNGLMSSFSQRNDRVLAAPGSSITSTVPDHTFGADGDHNDFGGASGTSMASPYVAGASVLVREAMEFAGVENITQDVIYDHFRDTAAQFFDSATSATYHRIDLQAAIDALIPSDDFGSTANAAHSLGSLSASADFSGSIGRLDDADYFTFTAAASGELTLTAADSFNHDTAWQLVGGESSSADTFTFDVVSGQSYTFSISTLDGIGHYSVAAELASDATDWGQVTSLEHNDVALTSSQTQFQVEASQAGLLTVEAMFAHAGGDVDLELLNSNGVVVASSSSATDNERLDATANQGDVFTLRVSGQHSEVDFRLTNLVSQNGGSVSVNGSAGDDAFSFTAGSTNWLSINDVTYSFASSQASSFNFLGGAGNDAITVTDSQGSASLTAQVGSMTFAGSGYSVSASSVEQLDATSNGGVANLHGSAGNDVFDASPAVATLSGSGYQHSARGFSQVNATNNGGYDTAVLHDSSGADQFYGRSGYAFMAGSGFLNQAIGFDRVEASASQSSDIARLYDSSGDDQFYGRTNYSFMSGTDFLNIATNFATVSAYSSAGNDVARLYDSAGDDVFVGREHYSFMSTSSSVNTANGFDTVLAYSQNGGNDSASLYDSAGDDAFVGRQAYSYLIGSGFSNTASGFDSVAAFSSTGTDTAKLYDTAGDETFVAFAQSATLSGVGFSNTATAFDSVEAFSTSGHDTARLFDSAGDDNFFGRADYAFMQGDGFLNVATNFAQVDAFAVSGGNDAAMLWDSAGDDKFYGRSEYSFMMGSGFLNVANGFQRVDSFASSGNDTAYLFDTAGDEQFYGRPTYAFIQGASFLNVANGFDRVEAFSNGGSDSAILTDSAGDDAFYGRESYAYMMGSGYINIAHQFGSVSAASIHGGNDQANLFGSAGSDSFLRTSSYERLSGAGFNHRTEGFGITRAHGGGGADAAVFQSLGSGDSIYGRDDYALLTDAQGDRVAIDDFDDLDVYSDVNGSPDTDIDSVDYVFEQLGDWS
jgi:subtilisin family serine protease